jgi:signal transduction histidine kinase
MLAKQLVAKVANVSSKVPIRAILVVPFVVQIFAAVGITGWLSLRNGQKAVNDVAAQLRSEISDRIEQKLGTYLATPHQIIQSNVAALTLGQLNVQDLAGLEHHFWHQIHIFNSAHSIVFGNEQKGFIGVENRNGSLVIMTSDRSTGYDLYTYTANSIPESGYNFDSRLKLISIDKNYDPRIRPWYKTAVVAGQPTWSDIFPQLTTQTLTLAAVQPFYDQTGKLEGVLNSSLHLSQVSSFLRSLKIGKTGQSFIIERSGMLVATSTPEKLFQLHKNKPERFNATDSNDAITQATAKYLVSQVSDLTKIKNSQQLEFTIHGKRQFLQVLPLQDDKGLDWLIVVVVPEADFIEQIDASTRTTILLCLLALFLATLLGLITSRWIVNPILQLSRAATALSQGDWKQTVPIERQDEVGILAQAFNRMAEQLRESFEELETRVKERTAKLQESENRERERALQVENTLRELQRTQSLIVQTEKMSSLGQVVAGVAHEINNPVNFIHANLTYTSQYTEDLLHLLALYQKHYPHPGAEIEEQAEAIDIKFLIDDFPKILDSMKYGTERIRKIVLSLRNFSRLDESKKKPVDIHEGIESTLLILQSRLKATPLRPEIQVIKEYGDLPKLECYAGHLNQVFMNIISNAIDAIASHLEVSTSHSPTAKKRLDNEIGKSELGINNGQFQSFITHYLSPTIRIRTTTIDNNWVEIRIADNGPGMTQEVNRKIFDPFFTTKPVGQGTGLGLSISYQIVVEQHGGQLQCISVPEQGTEFAIILPV